MACVSATLLLDLPQANGPHSGPYGCSTTPEIIRGLRRSLRDLEWNPQRTIPPDAGLSTLIEQRERAVACSTELRTKEPHNRSARRATFLEIRELNSRIGSARSDELVSRRTELQEALDNLDQNRVALGREYFFGLYGRAALEELLAALPSTKEFRV
jgi:hypothetical protein